MLVTSPYGQRIALKMPEWRRVLAHGAGSRVHRLLLPDERMALSPVITALRPARCSHAGTDCRGLSTACRIHMSGAALRCSCSPTRSDHFRVVAQTIV